MCIFYKRLDQRTFRIPEAASANVTHIEIEPSELDALLDGLSIAPQTH